MVKLLLVCAILASSLGSTYWIKKNSGDLSFTFLNYEVQTTVTEFFVYLLVGIIILQLVFFWLYKLLLLPKQIQAFIKEKKRDKLLEDSSEVLVDIFAKTADSVESRYRNMKKSISQDVDMLLAYMIEKLRDNAVGIKNKLILLTKSPRTSVPAYEELIAMAIEQKDWFVAASYCIELWKINKSPEIARLYVKCFINAKRWRELDEMLSANSKISSFFTKNVSNSLGKKNANIIKGICKYKIAEELHGLSEVDNAKKYALQSVKYLEGFLPSTCIAMKCTASSEGAYVKLAKKHWKIAPHYIIAEMIYRLSDNSLDEKFHKMLKDVASTSPSSYESKLLLASVALEADQFEIASKHLSAALDGGKKTRACLLMAEFCLRTHANKAEVIEWLRCAQSAQDDKQEQKYYWDLDKSKWINNESGSAVYIDTF